MQSKKRELLILVFFLLLTFLVRFPSFSQSAIGPDEGLYLLIAKKFTEGYLPYTVVWDNKPIGIYVLFSLALILLGNSVISIRIFACIAVFITCYFLYRLGKVISTNDIKVGLLAGILYAIFSAGIQGLMSDTEIFFTPFVVFAFYLLLSPQFNQTKLVKQHGLRLFTIGLVIGLALEIKQVVLFHFLAIILILGGKLSSRIGDKKQLFTEIIKSYSLLIIGAAVPLLLVSWFYLANGHFQEYFYANFLANVVRINDEKWSFVNFISGFLIQIKSNFILWLSLLLLPVYWGFGSSFNKNEKKSLFYLILWLLMGCVGVATPKSFYVYYFLQLLPPLCLISSFLIIKIVWAEKETQTIQKLLILALILTGSILNIIYPLFKVGLQSLYFQSVKDIDNWKDYPATIAAYLRERVKPDEYIYNFNYLTITYYLVPSKIPTRYAYPNFLLSRNLSKVARINPIKELQSILNKKPVYIIMARKKIPETGEMYIILDNFLEKHYIFEKKFMVNSDVFGYITPQTDVEDMQVELYRLKDKNISRKYSYLASSKTIK